MRMQYKSIISVLLFAVVFISCDKNVIFEENVKIPGEKWHKDSIVELSTSINDTINLYDIYLNLRHNTEYEYRNFYLFFETHLPNGMVVRDTLECILADKSGKWHGKGFGRIKSNRFHFRENVWFPSEGKYEFRIEQAMREDELNGIVDIGVRIEKNNK